MTFTGEDSDMAPLTFTCLDRYHVPHGIFHRLGGVSSGPFKSLNVGLNSGDAPGLVRENRRRVLASLGHDNGVFLEQVHGTDIHVVKKGAGKVPAWSEYNCAGQPIVADGVVTDVLGLALVIQVADCQGVLLFDPVKKVIANVHSGWRGSIKNIIGRCLDVMESRFGCLPENLRAGISPSLGPCCAEFIHYESEIPLEFWGYKHPDKPYFDFWRISCAQLTEKGVRKENIEVAGMCTACESDKFYSFRRENITGRFACVVALPPA